MGCNSQKQINTHKTRPSKTNEKKEKLVFTPGVTCVICLHVFVNMLYRDAARDLSCHLRNTLEGTSHNRDEEPSGIQVPDCLQQTLLEKKKKLKRM